MMVLRSSAHVLRCLQRRQYDRTEANIIARLSATVEGQSHINRTIVLVNRATNVRHLHDFTGEFESYK